MRSDLSHLDPYLIARGDDGGHWLIPSDATRELMIAIASWGLGWDHVSVSCRSRCPTWLEMEQIAKLFFMPSEAAMQLHVPFAEHVNCHPYCLHWWRPQRGRIPRPPSALVGGRPEDLAAALKTLAR
jgi:hypothetical protein